MVRSSSSDSTVAGSIQRGRSGSYAGDARMAAHSILMVAGGPSEPATSENLVALRLPATAFSCGSSRMRTLPGNSKKSSLIDSQGVFVTCVPQPDIVCVYGVARTGRTSSSRFAAFTVAVAMKRIAGSAAVGYDSVREPVNVCVNVHDSRVTLDVPVAEKSAVACRSLDRITWEFGCGVSPGFKRNGAGSIRKFRFMTTRAVSDPK